jgi:hypothetical protein
VFVCQSFSFIVKCVAIYRESCPRSFISINRFISLVLFHIHKSLYIILDKSMIIFIVTGNNNRRHTIIVYNSDYTGIALVCKT